MAKAKEDTVNLGGKQDLEALLRSWPASPPKGLAADGEDERGWDARADAIVRAASASARDKSAKDAAEALFAAPALAAEPGEEAAITAAGEKKMSQEKEPGEFTAPTAASAPPKRQSLKEIAARASQSSARLSNPGAAPSSVAPPSRASVVPPTPSAPTSLPRPSEAGKDDSGVINLQVVQATATAQQIAAAEKAKPAQAGLFDDDKPAEAAAAPAAKAEPEKQASNVVALPPPKKGNGGVVGGIVIALIGVAAAFAIVARKPPPPPAPAVAVEKAAPQQAPVATATPAPAAAPTTVASAEPAPSATADSKVAEAPKGGTIGAAPSGAATGAASSAASADSKVAAKAPTPTGKPGDLHSEMAKAVGADGAAKTDQSVALEPAAGGPKNQNIPEQPSQGAVAAAFGPVMGGAKACVAGADDVSRASVTFSSSGAVTSVSVSGWAAANGKSGCVQAALKAAKVGAFSKPSFTVGVPIRP